MKRVVVLFALMSLAVLVAGGVAFAANITCPTKDGTNLCVGTPQNDTMTGTTKADDMKGEEGHDTMRAQRGA